MGGVVESEEKSRWSVMSHVSRSSGPALASFLKQGEGDKEPSENMVCNLGDSDEGDRPTCEGGRESQGRLLGVDSSKDLLLLEGPLADDTCLPSREILEDATVDLTDGGPNTCIGPLNPPPMNFSRPTFLMSKPVSVCKEPNGLHNNYWSDSEALYPSEESDPVMRGQTSALTQPSSNRVAKKVSRQKPKKKYQKRVEEKEMWKSFVEDMVSDSELMGCGSLGRKKNTLCKRKDITEEASRAWKMGKDLGIIALDSEETVVKNIINKMGTVRDLKEKQGDTCMVSQ